jgi:amino acid permease
MEYELQEPNAKANEGQGANVEDEFEDSHDGSEADVESLASLRKQNGNPTEFKGRHIQMMALGTSSPLPCGGRSGTWC